MKKISKIVGLAALLSAAMGSQSVLAATYYSNQNITSTGTANQWDTGSCDSGTTNSTATTAADIFVICPNDTLTLAANLTLTTTGALQTQALGTVITGTNNITTAAALVNAGTINASGGGNITITGAVTNSGTITGGAGTISSAAFTNSGTLTAGAGNITTTGDFTNTGTVTGGNGVFSTGGNDLIHTSGSLTVGAGGLDTTNFTPGTGTVTLNGKLSIGGNILAGSAAISGTGTIELEDSDHTITGPVNLHNLTNAALGGTRTITINNVLTNSGTTILNGSGSNLISFTGTSGEFSSKVTSASCENAAGASAVSNIICLDDTAVPFASTTALWLFGGALGLLGLFGVSRARKNNVVTAA